MRYTEKNLTEGSVFKNTLLFSLPYLLSNLLQTLYGMADLYIVGLYRTVADTTAVSVGSQIMHMITVITVGLAMGTTVFVGRAMGEKDFKKSSRGIGNTVVLFSVFALFLTALLSCFTADIVDITATPVEARAGCEDYLRICFLGIPFITAYNVISAIFRSMGDSKSPTFFVLIACVMNIALDFLFIGKLGMGASGAALGTVISQGISAILSGTVLFGRKGNVKIGQKDFVPHKKTLKKILSVGVPVALQDGFIQVAFMIITVIANNRGLDDSAAVGIVEKIISFLFLVPSSLLSAVSVLGAQNIGAGKEDRAEKTLKYALITAIGFGFTVAVILQFFAENAVGLFTDEVKVAFLGGQYLRGYVWDCVFAGIHFCFSGYFCAIGKSGISFMHNVIAIVLMRVPGVYLTSKLFADTLYPMGLATSSGSVISSVICIGVFIYLKNQKKHKRA